MSGDDTVLACPECDSSSLTSLSWVADHAYRCDTCKAKIDAEDVVERERRSPGGIRSGTLAHKLGEMDPDDPGGRFA